MENLNQKNTSRFELPPQLKNSKNYMAEIVLVLIIIGAVYWVLVRPKMAALSVQKDQLAQLETMQGSLEHDIGKMQQLIRDMKSHPQDIAKLDEALPLQSRTLRVNLLMKTLAGSSGVTLRDVNFAVKGDTIAAGNKELLAQPFAGARTLQSIPGTVLVTGSYDNLQAFIKKVENNSRIMDITSMDISGVDKDTLSLKLELTTYFYE